MSAASAPATATPGDTTRGIVTEVGNAPITTLLLVPVDSTRDRVALAGAALPMLRNAVGLEIVVRGRLTNDRVAAASPRGVPVFAVKQFEVRAADGQPAHDGIVTLNRNQFSLRLGDGRMVRVVAMPTLLRDKVGARVFLVGKLDQPPLSYGILAEAK